MSDAGALLTVNLGYEAMRDERIEEGHRSLSLAHTVYWMNDIIPFWILSIITDRTRSHTITYC